MSLGLYRALLMSRGFVDSIFKSKARWSAALLGTILVSNLVGLLPSTSEIISFLTFLPFLAVVVVSFGFVDRTILVANRMDFFHRDALSWGRGRIPAFVALLIAIAFFLPGTLYPATASPPTWVVDGNYAFVPIAVIVLGYGAAALGVSARRSHDKTLRRHIMLLGVSLAMFVALIGFFALPTTDIFTTIGDVISLVSLAVLYLAVMSLTPLGRVEKRSSEAGTAGPTSSSISSSTR